MVPASARSTISLELTIMTRYDRMNIAQGPCVAAREGFEPTTLQSKGIDSTNLPPRPTSAIRCIGGNLALDLGATKIITSYKRIHKFLELNFRMAFLDLNFYFSGQNSW